MDHASALGIVVVALFCRARDASSEMCPSRRTKGMGGSLKEEC